MAHVRTSSSHPITISHVLSFQGGTVGLCFCPGKVVTRSAVKHERDLHLDLQHLKEQHSITCVLCLLNTAELRSFGLRDYEAGIKKSGLRLLNFPIIEMAAPVCIDATHTIIKQTAELLTQGHHIAVHCRGGVGRAGMIAACLLLYTNQASNPKEAIQLIRQRRCKAAIETSRQEDFVAKYAQHCSHNTGQEATGAETADEEIALVDARAGATTAA